MRSLVTKTQGADGIVRPALRHTQRCQISHPADVIIGRDTQVRENRQWAVWLGQKHREPKSDLYHLIVSLFQEATERKALIG